MSVIRRLHEKLCSGEISCTQLTQQYIDAIKDNVELNAYITITEKSALEQAKSVDEKIANGEQIGLLEGIPMALKDNISTKGIRTTCGSKMLCDYTPVYDASVWETLKAEGAILLGKTNMDEFAMGSSTETSYFGATKNPHNKDCCAGGSSGGSAAAVAGDLAVFTLGSDTGGSVRQPASFCGVVGLKPTYGTVSRYGLIAYASSLDQIGPISKTVEDTAIVFDAISKKDERDSTCVGMNETVLSTLNDDIKGKKIAVVKEYFEGVSDDVKNAVLSKIEVYKSLGAQIVEISMPQLKTALPVYYILACAEASSNLGRYDGIRYGYKAEHYDGVHDMVCKTRSEGFSEKVKRRILLGTYVLSSGYYDAYYRKAQNLRGVIVKAFDEVFEKVDAIIAPTAPVTAFPLGYAMSDDVRTYQTDICTVPVNIAGLPAVSIPCSVDSNNMPVGMQLIGNRFDEKTIINLAYKFEQETKDEKWGAGSEI